VGGRRLPIHQAPRLERGLLGIALALDHQAGFLGPPRRLLLRVSPHDVGKRLLQDFVRLELVLDLPEELSRDPLGVREDADRYLWVAQDFLYRPGEGDDRGLVVLASPQVEMVVRRPLNLSTPSI
jgi:hypothetical protein